MIGIKKMKKDKNIVTLDIGGQSIKVLELEKTPQEWQIVDYFEKQIPSREDKNRDEIIPELLKEIPILNQSKNKRVIGVLPRHLFSVKYITLPSENYNEIARMIPFEAEKVFPFSLAKFELGFAVQKILPDKNAAILLAAVNKTFIEKLLNQLEKANLVIERIGLSSLALARAYLAQKKENAALINLGEAAAEIDIIYEGSMAFTRSFPIAGKHLSQALMNDLNLTGEEAEKLKLEGAWPKEKSLPSVEDWHKRLILEIKRTIEAFLKDYPQADLSEIILSGGGYKLSALKDFIHSKVNLRTSFFPFEKISISEGIKKKFLGESHLFPIALGLGLEQAKTAPFNLIPQEFREKTSRKKKRKKLIFAAAATAGFLLLLQLFLGMALLWQTGRKKIIQRNLARLEPAATGVMEKKEEIALLQVYLEGFSPLEVLRELSEIIPETVVISQFSLDKDGKAGIAGLTQDHGEVSDLIRNLEKSPRFYNVFSRYSRTKNKQGKNFVEFAISFFME